MTNDNTYDSGGSYPYGWGGYGGEADYGQGVEPGHPAQEYELDGDFAPGDAAGDGRAEPRQDAAAAAHGGGFPPGLGPEHSHGYDVGLGQLPDYPAGYGPGYGTDAAHGVAAEYGFDPGYPAAPEYGSGLGHAPGEGDFTAGAPGHAADSGYVPGVYGASAGHPVDGAGYPAQGGYGTPAGYPPETGHPGPGQLSGPGAEGQPMPGPMEGWGSEYDADTTAFVQLPTNGWPGLEAHAATDADTYGGPAAGPLAAPGTGQGGYTPPRIEVTQTAAGTAGPTGGLLTPGATTDPAGTGQWTLPYQAPPTGGERQEAGTAAQPAEPELDGDTGHFTDGGGSDSVAGPAAMGQGAAAALAGSHEARHSGSTTGQPHRRPLGAGGGAGVLPPDAFERQPEAVEQQPDAAQLGQEAAEDAQPEPRSDMGAFAGPGDPLGLADTQGMPLPGGFPPDVPQEVQRHSDELLADAQARRQVPFDGAALDGVAAGAATGGAPDSGAADGTGAGGPRAGAASGMPPGAAAPNSHAATPPPGASLPDGPAASGVPGPAPAPPDTGVPDAVPEPGAGPDTVQLSPVSEAGDEAPSDSAAHRAPSPSVPNPSDPDAVAAGPAAPAGDAWPGEAFPGTASRSWDAPPAEDPGDTGAVPGDGEPAADEAGTDEADGETEAQESPADPAAKPANPANPAQPANEDSPAGTSARRMESPSRSRIPWTPSVPGRGLSGAPVSGTGWGGPEAASDAVPDAAPEAEPFAGAVPQHDVGVPADPVPPQPGQSWPTPEQQQPAPERPDAAAEFAESGAGEAPGEHAPGQEGDAPDETAAAVSHAPAPEAATSEEGVPEHRRPDHGSPQAAAEHAGDDALLAAGHTTPEQPGTAPSDTSGAGVPEPGAAHGASTAEPAPHSTSADTTSSESAPGTQHGAGVTESAADTGHQWDVSGVSVSGDRAPAARHTPDDVVEYTPQDDTAQAEHPAGAQPSDPAADVPSPHAELAVADPSDAEPEAAAEGETGAEPAVAAEPAAPVQSQASGDPAEPGGDATPGMPGHIHPDSGGAPPATDPAGTETTGDGGVEAVVWDDGAAPDGPTSGVPEAEVPETDVPETDVLAPDAPEVGSETGESGELPHEPAGLHAGEAAGEQGLEEVPAGPVEDDHPHTSYVLHVNGVDRPVTNSWIGESLLYVLRERLGLAGAKDGCSQGECGACSVQVDGRLVAACLVPAATSAGTEIRTVEGLAADDGAPSDVQRALTECGAVQCGFCVPGLAMTVHDLLEGNHAPSELETRKAICGNLCRCSGYGGVLDAVHQVVGERQQAARAAEVEAEAEAESQRSPAGQAHVPSAQPGQPPQPADDTQPAVPAEQLDGQAGADWDPGTSGDGVRIPQQGGPGSGGVRYSQGGGA